MPLLIEHEKGFNIAHVVEACLGGTSTYLETIINYQQNQNNISKVYLIACKNKITSSLIETVKEIYYYKSSRNIIKILSTSLKIISFINLYKPEIVHLHGTFPGIYVRLFRYFIKYNPIIIYCAHGWSFCQDVSQILKIIYAKIEKILSQKTDAIINISQHEHKSAESYGVISKYNFMLYNGVRDKIITNNNPICINKGKINLLFIGRFDRQKGIDILVKLLKKETFPNINIYAIGKHDRNKNRFDLGEKIHLLGWVNPKEVDDYYKLIDAIIVPSRWEGFGLVTIEAMRNSKPVIASNRGALPEIVIDGINGFIFNINDLCSLSKILKDLDKLTLLKMGENGRRLYEERFSLSRFNKDLMAIYFKLLQNQ
jgi:glycosyltransferase involved in cell wall biosynthesis